MSDLADRIEQANALEEESDLYAAGGDFRNASLLMRQANQVRADILELPRSTDPNVLREKCAALRSQGEGHG